MKKSDINTVLKNQGIEYYTIKGNAMKSIDEMIKVMEHFKNGGEIKVSSDKLHWFLEKCPKWNWGNVDYRIKELVLVV